MIFNPAAPYELKFGRGSGLDGYDTVVIDEAGHVQKLRPNPGRFEDGKQYYWETSDSSIPREAARQIGKLILDHQLLELEREYHADVEDGSQWTFWLIQGNAEKRISFNNHFPEAIQDFAVAFDHIFFESQFDATEWEPLSDELEREQIDELWE